jgi:putative endonuclease
MFYVYILANPRPQSRVLYVGVTADLCVRVAWHRARVSGFTAKYNVTSLVYCETFREVEQAITREKQIKGWSRAKKIALIVTGNPTWRDLFEGAS